MPVPSGVPRIVPCWTVERRPVFCVCLSSPDAAQRARLRRRPEARRARPAARPRRAPRARPGARRVVPRARGMSEGMVMPRTLGIPDTRRQAAEAGLPRRRAPAAERGARLGRQRAREARVLPLRAPDQTAAAAVAGRLGDARVLEHAKAGADGQRPAGPHADACRAPMPGRARPTTSPSHKNAPPSRSPALRHSARSGRPVAPEIAASSGSRCASQLLVQAQQQRLLVGQRRTSDGSPARASPSHAVRAAGQGDVRDRRVAGRELEPHLARAPSPGSARRTAASRPLARQAPTRSPPPAAFRRCPCDRCPSRRSHARSGRRGAGPGSISSPAGTHPSGATSRVPRTSWPPKCARAAASVSASGAASGSDAGCGRSMTGAVRTVVQGMQRVACPVDRVRLGYPNTWSRGLALNARCRRSVLAITRTLTLAALSRWSPVRGHPRRRGPRARC